MSAGSSSPRMKQPSETAIFLHVPKAAGTTLNRIIDRHYRRDEIYSILGVATPQSGTLEELRRLPARQRASIRLVRGHFAFGIHDMLAGPSTYFTLLRNPRDRVLSHYFHALRQPDNHLHRYVNGLTLSDVFARRGHVDKAFDNFQTRLLSGVWDTPAFGACNQETLERAKENLRHHFSVVGVVHRFDETLLLLQQRFGWRFVYYTRHNVRRRRGRLPPADAETLALIRDHNRLDQQLYDFASALCAQQVAQAGQPFQERLRRFQAINRILGPGLRFYWRMRKISVRSALKKRIP